MLWDHLTSTRFLDRGVVSPEFVRTLLEEHDTRRRNNETWLWSLLVLDLWFQQVEAPQTPAHPRLRGHEKIGSRKYMEFYTWDQMEKEVLSQTIARKIISGEKAMVSQVFLAKGAVVPEHHHESEQITYILEGALKFEIEGQEIVVGKGQVLLYPLQRAASRRGSRRHARSRHLQPHPHRLAATRRRLSARLIMWPRPSRTS